MSLSNIAISNIKVSDYRCIISLISKNGAIYLMQNADLTFRKIKIEKKNYRRKSFLFLNDVDIKKVLVSNKISFCEKEL